MTKLCKSPIPMHEMDNIMNHFPELIAIQRRDGRVSTEELNNLKIYNVKYMCIVCVLYMN